MEFCSVVLVDDHALYCEGVKALLLDQQQFPIHSVKIFHDGSVFFDAITTINPSIILLDLNLPGKSGLELLPAIKSNLPETKVIIVSMYDQAKYIKETLQSGADGYLIKTSGLSELINAIEAVINGETFLGEGLMIFPKEAVASNQNGFEDDFTIRNKLTKREMEVLTLISKAMSNKRIAEELFISDQTVSVHRKNIMRKLNVTNTASLIKFAIDHDLV